MKTINYISIDTASKNYVVNYTNEINGSSIYTSTYTTDISVSGITDIINALPKARAKVVYVSLLNDTFSISGEFYPLKTEEVSSLTAPQIATVDALKAFILSYTGGALTSLLGEIGKDKVVINGITYEGQTYLDMVAASTGTIQSAILLTFDIFNA